MDEDKRGQVDVTNQYGAEDKKEEELKLVFPFPGAKTYLRSPAFYLSSDSAISKAQFEAHIFSGNNRVAKVVFDASFECGNELKKHFSRGKLRPIDGGAETLAPGEYKIKLAAVSGTTNTAATSPNATLQPGTYTFELEGSIFSSENTTVITFEVVHFLYPLPDRALYEKRPRFFFDPDALGDNSGETNKSSLYSLQKNGVNGTPISLIRPHKDAFYLVPDVQNGNPGDLEDGEYSVQYNGKEIFKISIPKKSAQGKVAHFLHSFVRDIKSTLDNSYPVAVNMWNSKKVEKEEKAFWETGSISIDDSRIVINEQINVTPKSHENKPLFEMLKSEYLGYFNRWCNAEKQGIGMEARAFSTSKFQECHLDISGLAKEKYEKFYDHINYEMTLNALTSKWLKGNLDHYQAFWLILHLHRPYVFPFWNTHVDTAFGKHGLNIIFKTQTQNEKVSKYQALTEAVENLINTDALLKAEVGKLIKAGAWHFDFMTHFLKFVEEYINGRRVYHMLQTNPQVIYYGPPGTGKTYRALAEAEWMVNWYLWKYFDNNSKSVDSDNFIKVLQLHPAYSYEDFIEGLRPKATDSGLTYEVQEGPFKAFCRQAGVLERYVYELAHATELTSSTKNTTSEMTGIWEGKVKIEDSKLTFLTLSGESNESITLDWSNKTTPEARLKAFHEILPDIKQPLYFFILDEFNRANLSTVLGELLYCLEYRGPLHALDLPYSGNKKEGAFAWSNTSNRNQFFIPSNVRIIGTMNTIDRSTEPVDFALRRRFGWVKFNPAIHTMKQVLKRELVDDWGKEIELTGKDNKTTKVKLIDRLVSLIYSVNDKLKTDLGKRGEDYQIGETYLYKFPKIWFLSKESVGAKKYRESLAKLYEIFIKPQLQEYYAGDNLWDEVKNKYEEFFCVAGSATAQKTAAQIWESLQINPQVIIYGPPGTGKTYVLENDLKEYESPKGTKLFNENCWEFLQFHPSYSYEDFLQGIRPEVESGGQTGNSKVNYKLKSGKFKEFCVKAGTLERLLFTMFQIPPEEGSLPAHWITLFISNLTFNDNLVNASISFSGSCWVVMYSNQDDEQKINLKISNYKMEISKDSNESEEPKCFDLSNLKHTRKDIIDHILSLINQQPYVMVIDEINRGQLSAIFGELMFCLEYRGPEGYIELPYSSKENKDQYFAERDGQEVFFIPTNLKLIGTMNTIDRSTELIDYALRRRFAWLRFGPAGDRQFICAVLKIFRKLFPPKDRKELEFRKKEKLPSLKLAIGIDDMESFKHENFKDQTVPKIIDSKTNTDPKKKGLSQIRPDEIKKQITGKQINLINETQQLWEIFELINQELAKEADWSEDFRVGETYFYKVPTLLKQVRATNAKVTSIFEKIEDGPFDGSAVIWLLYDYHLKPLLEDYYSFSGNWDEDVFKRIINDYVEGAAKKQLGKK